jgi:hypothetical protein
MVFDFKEEKYQDVELTDDRKNLIDLALGAFRSIRFPVAYVSMPITSGKLLYEVLEKKGCKTLEELSKVDKDAIYRDIIKPNVDMGIHAADTIRSPLPPLAPSIFEGKKFPWNQEEYMALWFKVIEERAREMHMTDGWEYSNGGVQEFTLAMMMFHKTPWWNQKRFKSLAEEDYEQVVEDMSKIRVFDISGKVLCLEEGYKLVGNAIKDLEKRGFNPDSLKESSTDLKNVIGLFYQHSLSASEYYYHRGQLSKSKMIYLNSCPA